MDLENADVQSGTSDKNKNKEENNEWFLSDLSKN
jgi:hypothetical protein